MSGERETHDEPLGLFGKSTAVREQVIARFEQAWQQGARPAIEAYLVGEGEEQHALLLELVHADLECRLKVGESARVEEYLQRFPALAADDRAVVQLLHAEYRLRGRLNLSLDNDEYLARFPQYRQQLSHLSNVIVGEWQQADAGSAAGPWTDRSALGSAAASPCPTTAAPDKTPAHIGRYRVDKLLGRGGFGLVYLAYDDQLDRPVAIKVPYPGRAFGPQDAQQHLAEARAVAQLEHPHIVPVHDFGSTPEYPCYIVSKYIPGASLANLLASARPNLRQSAELIAKLAEALHHAHRHGLVHRDVKPHNILVDETGQPFLVDFGLALRDVDAGQSPRYAGTPAYMSPEQARGESHRVDGRSDIFSLGLVFYELLLGRHPFRGSTRAEWWEQITAVEPRPPRQVDDAIPRELERICLKALSKRAADRYTTAKDMAEDLRHFLASHRLAMSPDALPAGVGTNVAADTPQAGSSATAGSGLSPLRIVPKGLRSFDEQDADFFLELLPGPRDRHGLPGSLRFWKTRIEETRTERTFPVGLIYGPSGCGNSSLLKAGLLPRLGDHVSCALVEATPDDTEARLLSCVRRACPAVPRTWGLHDSLGAVRRGRGIPAGQKLLVVLDQFEQWLHTHDGQLNTELATALRQCDGGRLQCVALVRDDFFIAANRFMQDLEVRLVEGRNMTLVDLFDPLHARKVLTAFGRAYGRLPERMVELSPAQESFLDRAIKGLTQDGRIISVRLALFADMLKGKPWTTTTLSQVGGTAGLGVTFLEETLSASTAPAAHRQHQKAAQAVLRSLLPEAGSDIKGSRRSYEVLLDASGYAPRPKDFDDLIQILDGEIRLITPTVPAGEDVESVAASAGHSSSRLPPPAASLPSPAFSLRHYQLTHDYLVPSLRDWLNRKQKETRRGRAELRLAERSALWNAKHDNRNLPKAWEHLNIRLLTRKRDWTEPQRQMMRLSGRFHSLRVATLAIAVGLIGWCGYEINGSYQADKLLIALDGAKEDAVLGIVDQLSPYRSWALPGLQDRVAMNTKTPAEQRRQLHARIALAAEDGTQVPQLLNVLLAAEYSYVGVLRDALTDYRGELCTQLWTTFHDLSAPSSQRFRAALALASYDSTSENWSATDLRFLAEQLVAASPVDQPRLWEFLRPISARLVPDLATIFDDQKRSESQQVSAANALAVFARDDGPRLTRLLTTATAAQYEILYALVSSWPDDTVKAVLANMVAQQPAANLSQPARVALGRQRAGAAISLLRLGETATSHGALQVQDDPESLTQFVHRCRERGVTTTQLVNSLRSSTEVHSRFALLLALGDWSPADIDARERDRLIKDLIEAYRSDPSSAIHGASGWLLRKWGFVAETSKVDDTPIAYDETGKREWYVVGVVPARAGLTEVGSDRPHGDQAGNGQVCFTLVVFQPGEYTMGAPEDEADYQPDERLQRVRLTRPLAVSTHEVTWEQYDPFDRGQTHLAAEQRYRRELTPQEPVSDVNWFEAGEYCRWLTAQAGWPESEQCYDDPPSLPKDSGGSPTQWPVHLGRRGFRLLTETEWEYVYRSGMRTAYGIGNDPSLLTHYAWFVDNSEKWSHEVGQLRPSLRGLFDISGNLHEWCHDWYDRGLSDTSMDPIGANAGTYRVYRGGAWNYPASHCRAAFREGDVPTNRVSDLGFRVATDPSGK